MERQDVLRHGYKDCTQRRQLLDKVKRALKFLGLSAFEYSLLRWRFVRPVAASAVSSIRTPDGSLAPSETGAADVPSP